jgi:hypothetical protein
MVGINGLLARIVGRNGQGQITRISVEQVAQMPHAPRNVLERMVHVAYPKRGRGLGHQLHQPARPSSGHRSRVEGGFDGDYRLNERRVYVIRGGNLFDCS